jgi:hypothetical protein
MQAVGGTRHRSRICAAKCPEKAAEADQRRELLMGLGIDPDTMEVKVRSYKLGSSPNGGSSAKTLEARSKVVRGSEGAGGLFATVSGRREVLELHR